MSAEKKEFDNEMRGTLWQETDRKSEKSPAATGTVTISGLELRIAMWPVRVAKDGTKAAGKKYWPILVEYKQGTQFVLAKVSPADITVTEGVANVPGAGSGEPEAAASDPGDLPF